MPIDVYQAALKSKRDFMLKVLSSYGIKCDDISVNQQLNIDLYNVKLSMGCRSSRVDNILKDIGMQLKAYSEPMGFVSTSDGVYKISVQKNQIRSLLANQRTCCISPTSSTTYSCGQGSRCRWKNTR